VKSNGASQLLLRDTQKHITTGGVASKLGTLQGDQWKRTEGEEDNNNAINLANNATKVANNAINLANNATKVANNAINLATGILVINEISPESSE